MKQRKMASRSLWASTVAFEGTERRFNEVNSGIPKDRLGNRAPAPGAYTPQTTLLDKNELGSKPNPNLGPFLSKDTRFRRPRDWKSDSMDKPRKGLVESVALAESLEDPAAKKAHFLSQKDRDLSMLRGNLLRGGTAPLRAAASAGSIGGSESMAHGRTIPKVPIHTCPACFRVLLFPSCVSLPRWLTSHVHATHRACCLNSPHFSFAHAPCIIKYQAKGRFKDPDDIGPPPNAYHCEVKWSTGAVSMAPVVVQSRKRPPMPLPGPGEYVAPNGTIAQHAQQVRRVLFATPYLGLYLSLSKPLSEPLSVSRSTRSRCGASYLPPLSRPLSLLI